MKKSSLGKGKALKEPDDLFKAKREIAAEAK